MTTKEWPFRIMENGEKSAFVDEATDEPFGIIDSEKFNLVLVNWLIAKAPNLIIMAADAIEKADEDDTDDENAN